MLESMLKSPAPEACIFDVGGCPVITSWGMVESGASTVTEEFVDRGRGRKTKTVTETAPANIARLKPSPEKETAPTPPVPPVAPPTAPVNPPESGKPKETAARSAGPGWLKYLLWLLLLLLLLLLLWLLWKFLSGLFASRTPEVYPDTARPAATAPADDRVMAPDSTVKPVADPYSEGSKFFEKNVMDFNSGLYNSDNRQLELRIVFDSGDKTARAELRDGKQICRSAVDMAKKDASNIFIGVDHMTCPDGDTYKPFSISCNKGADVACMVYNSEGKHWYIPVIESTIKEEQR
jgi:hypothetical protein